MLCVDEMDRLGEFGVVLGLSFAIEFQNFCERLRVGFEMLCEILIKETGGSHLKRLFSAPA
ncbi:MAG: hypothetical protein ACRER2_19445 [Methylococcales bacterium]